LERGRDINNILNTGSVPNLFPQEDIMQLVDAVGPRARAVGKGQTMTDCFEFFIDTCRANMHCVLCMSPIGDDLRNRLRFVTIFCYLLLGTCTDTYGLLLLTLQALLTSLPRSDHCVLLASYSFTADRIPTEFHLHFAHHLLHLPLLALHSVLLTPHSLLQLLYLYSDFDNYRSFPSLVNCCTIDWFFPWPEDGLVAVADQFLADLGLEDAMSKAVVEQCMSFQVSSRMLSEKYQAELGRINYVTPTSYLELIGTLKALLNKKKTEVSDERNRYVVGIDKILSCEASVDVMKKELIELQPVLVVKTKEVEELIVVLDKEKADAAVVKERTAQEEAVAAEEARKTNEMKESCEADLAEAIPALNAAVAALNSLTKGDITEMKMMKNPPKLVKLVMEGVCIMLEVKPEKKAAEDGKGKVDDYWGPATKLLSDLNFLNRLIDYDKDNMSEAVVKKIKTYVAMEEFQPEVMLMLATLKFSQVACCQRYFDHRARSCY